VFDVSDHVSRRLYMSYGFTLVLHLFVIELSSSVVIFCLQKDNVFNPSCSFWEFSEK
jgi:hypothetical protein